MRPTTRWEVSTTGFDPDLQALGADPNGSPYYVGMRIPVVPADDPRNRYLFLLALARFDANERARLVGIKTLLTIGTYTQAAPVEGQVQGKYPLVKEVKSPFFRFTDGNVSYHLKRVPPMVMSNASPFNAEGQIFQYGETPALLFQRAAGEAGGYVPPNGGNPWGDSLITDLATWHGERFPWQSQESWLDCEIEGPCDIALFASVRQTKPGTRVRLTLPGSLSAGTGCIPEEDAFVADFPPSGTTLPGVIYWSIAGSLIFEWADMYPIPAKIEPQSKIWCPTGAPLVPYSGAPEDGGNYGGRRGGREGGGIWLPPPRGGEPPPPKGSGSFVPGSTPGKMEK